MSGGRSTKEKVLHTRVPEALDTQIKALADALRVPVSSLVRNILEDSVAVIDSATSGLDETLKNVTRNVRSLSARAREDQKELRRGWTEFQSILAERFRGRAGPQAEIREDPDGEPPPASQLFPEVVGWQALTLNVGTACARCGLRLSPGEPGHLGVRERPGARVIICETCIPQLRADGSFSEPERQEKELS